MARNEIPDILPVDDDDPRYSGVGYERSSSLDDYTRTPIYDPSTRTPYEKIVNKSPVFGIMALVFAGAANLLTLAVFFPLQQVATDTSLLSVVSWLLFFVECILGMIAITANFGAKYGVAAVIVAIALNPYIIITVTFMASAVTT